MTGQQASRQIAPSMTLAAKDCVPLLAHVLLGLMLGFGAPLTLHAETPVPVPPPPVGAVIDARTRLAMLVEPRLIGCPLDDAACIEQLHQEAAKLQQTLGVQFQPRGTDSLPFDWTPRLNTQALRLGVTGLFHLDFLTAYDAFPDRDPRQATATQRRMMLTTRGVREVVMFPGRSPDTARGHYDDTGTQLHSREHCSYIMEHAIDCLPLGNRQWRCEHVAGQSSRYTFWDSGNIKSMKLSELLTDATLYQVHFLVTKFDAPPTIGDCRMGSVGIDLNRDVGMHQLPDLLCPNDQYAVQFSPMPLYFIPCDRVSPAASTAHPAPDHSR